MESSCSVIVSGTTNEERKIFVQASRFILFGMRLSFCEGKGAGGQGSVAHEFM